MMKKKNRNSIVFIIKKKNKFFITKEKQFLIIKEK